MTIITIDSLIVPSAQVTIDPYGTNPLADEHKQYDPGYVQRRQLAGGWPGLAPKLFTSGSEDLPAFTASGIDPQLLLRLPYRIRHYAAAMVSPDQVYELFERHAADPFAHIPHPGLDEAVRRVRRWARLTQPDEETSR